MVLQIYLEKRQENIENIEWMIVIRNFWKNYVTEGLVHKHVQRDQKKLMFHLRVRTVMAEIFSHKDLQDLVDLLILVRVVMDRGKQQAAGLTNHFQEEAGTSNGKRIRQ